MSLYSKKKKIEQCIEILMYEGDISMDILKDIKKLETFFTIMHAVIPVKDEVTGLYDLSNRPVQAIAMNGKPLLVLDLLNTHDIDEMEKKYPLRIDYPGLEGLIYVTREEYASLRYEWESLMSLRKHENRD
jgi:hypothetical protein